MRGLDEIEAALAAILQGGKSEIDGGGKGGASAELRLQEAIRWAVEGGGKRVRPRLCLAAAVAAGGREEDAVMPACAIELLHSYTLVHDDLPSMDNDVERRGKPSVWAKFGEAVAILAGDALQAMAFSTAARSPRNASRIVASLAAAAVAVVRGQAADLGEEGEASASQYLHSSTSPLAFIFENKTAALFVAAAEMGALAAGASESSIVSLREYARNLGFAFQYEYDLLDRGDGAFSSLSVFGEDEVCRRVQSHTDAALAALKSLPGDSEPLAELALSLVSRRR